MPKLKWIKDYRRFKKGRLHTCNEQNATILIGLGFAELYVKKKRKTKCKPQNTDIA